MTKQTSKPGSSYTHHVLQSPLELPCGAVLKNRLAKSPMSDSLGDGAGDSTEAQARLYERWAQGGAADMVELARAMVLDPGLADAWLGEEGGDPEFPRFDAPPRGGITAWFSMRMTALGEDNEDNFTLDPHSALRVYEQRDERRCVKWQEKFA